MCNAGDYIKGFKEEDRKIIDRLKKSIFPIVRTFILKNNGTLEDAKDVFNDTILIVCDKIKNNNFTLTCGFPTFFMSICVRLWYKELRKKTEIVSIDSFMTEEFTDMPYDLIETEIEEYGLKIDEPVDTPYDPTEDKKFEIFLSAFEKLDPKCKELMKLSFENKSNPEIARIMNFQKTQAVADKKNSCIKKLAKELTQSKDYKEFINENN